jgi:hypothetical protein
MDTAEVELANALVVMVGVGGTTTRLAETSLPAPRSFLPHSGRGGSSEALQQG